MSNNGDSRRVLLSLLIYGGGGFMILVGIGLLFDGIRSILAGLIMITCGLLAIPPTRLLVSAISDQLGGPTIGSIGRVGAAALVIGGFVVGGVVAGGGNDAPQTSDPVITEAPTATPEPTVDTTTAPSGTTKTATPTQATTTASSGPATGWSVTVIDVVDGDTMDVRFSDGSTDTIRLLGVDSPETTVSDTDPPEWENIPDSYDGRSWLANWGRQADAYANSRLSVGSTIYIEVDETADRRGSFDRLLVYAYQSESASKSFNLRLIENGYARLYDTQFAKRTSFASAESTAQSNRVGVWGYSQSTSTETESKGGGGGGNLVVANVHADASGNDHENLNGEYVTFRNDGSSSIDMSGWTVSDEADHVYYVPSGFSLGPGETVTLYTGSGTNSDSELYWGSDSAVWNNGGDTIFVRTGDGKTIIEYEY